MWDSGKIKVIGDVSFDQVCFYVWPRKGSDIYYDKTNHSISLRGRAYANHLEMIDRVDNMVISYDGSADNER